MFQNPEVAIENLPGTDQLQWHNLDPALKRLQQLVSLLVMLGAAIPIAIVTIAVDLPGVVIIGIWSQWLLALVLLLIWPGIALPKRGYVVRDKDILFRKGVIWRSVTAVPYNRIQHVETSSTPLDRKFGLATLQLFTAGGSSGDLKIDGLAEARAEKLRVYVLKKAGASIENH